MKNELKYYLTPILLVLSLNSILFYFIGSYYESYEVVFSSLVQGVYTDFSTNIWNQDGHFLLFAIYAYINSYVPTLQVYGIVMLLYNLVSLSFFGIVLYRIMDTNVKFKNYFVFSLFYLLVAVNNFFLLSINRIALLLIVSVILYIESKKHECQVVILKNKLLLIILVLLACLIRVEVVLVLSVLYALVLICFRKFDVFSSAPIIISFSVLCLFNYFMSQQSEGRQVYHYKEKSFFDRGNIDYNKLSFEMAHEVKLFREYGIPDKQHFTFQFYDNIEYVRPFFKNNLISNFVSGFHPVLLRNTFVNTIERLDLLSYISLFYCVLNMFILYRLSRLSLVRFKLLYYFLGILLFPFFLCFYISLPVSFLNPYYFVVGTLNSILVLMYSKKIMRYMLPIYLFILTFELVYVLNEKKY